MLIVLEKRPFEPSLFHSPLPRRAKVWKAVSAPSTTAQAKRDWTGRLGPFAKDRLLILLRRHLALEEQGVSGQENRFVKPAFRSLSPKAVDNLW